MRSYRSSNPKDIGVKGEAIPRKCEEKAYIVVYLNGSSFVKAQLSSDDVIPLPSNSTLHIQSPYDQVNTQHIKMPLFMRSSKNQSSSAASTPTQTPRVSMQEDQRPVQPTEKMTREQAIGSIMAKAMANAISRAYIR
ncbi:hypothetical protein BGX26_012845 [Mortierella sp. AD094]|nr:hypothetical protein BGX26_012845 [Mortierella sp. AD094]